MSQVTFVVGPPGSGKTFYGLQALPNAISLQSFAEDLVLADQTGSPFPLLEKALGWDEKQTDDPGTVFLDNLDLVPKIQLYRAAGLRRWRRTRFIVACRTGYFTSNQEIVNHVAPIFQTDPREELLTIHQVDFIDPKYEQDVEYWLQREIARLDDPYLSKHIPETISLLEKLALGDLEDSRFTRDLLIEVKEGKYDSEYRGKSEKTNFCVVPADADDDAPPGDFSIDTWAVELLRGVSRPVQTLLNAILVADSPCTRYFWSSKMRDKLAMCCVLQNPAKNLDRIWLRSQYHLLDLIDEKQDITVVESLCDVVLKTRFGKATPIAGANAMTLLVRIRGLIPLKDLRKVRIAGADLSASTLLSDANLLGADLRGCDFTGTDFKVPALQLDNEFAHNTDRLSSLLLSSDGMHLYSGSYQGATRVWDLSTRQCVRSMVRQAGSVRTIVLSTDGKWLYSGSGDKSIQMWDLSMGQCTHTFQGHTDWVTCLALSVDGKRLYSGSDDRTIRMWDVFTGQTLRVMQGQGSHIYALALSADGKLLYSGSADNTIQTWDLSTGQTVNVMRGHTNQVTCLALSADGKWLYSGSDDATIRVWDLSTGQTSRVMQGHTDNVWSLALSADGKWLYSGSCDRTIRMWDLSTGQTLRVMKGHTDYVRSLVLSGDDKWLYSGSFDKTIRMWNVERKHKLNGSCKPL